MARYLIKRRDDDEIATIADRYRGATEEAGKERIAELIRLRQAQGPLREAMEWIRDTRATLGVGDPPPTLTPAPFTGLCVVDLDRGSAGRLAADLPDHEVIEDRAVTLIAPVAYKPPKVPHAQRPWQWAHELLNVHRVRAQGLTGKGVQVAVLDTGVDTTHPELVGRVAKAVKVSANKPGWSVQSPSSDIGVHGTHVAGLIAGKDVGVAPGATLLSCAMLVQSRGNESDIASALEWTVSHWQSNPTLRIVNMSAGLTGFRVHSALLKVVRQIVDFARIIPVFAVGNEGRNRTRSPGNYDAVLSVGACDERKRVAPFSSGGVIHHENHAFTVPDVVAPGVDVYSSVPGGAYGLCDGTSMATPLVSGIAALLCEKYPSATPHDIIDAIVSTCCDTGCVSERQGAGVVDAERALAYLVATTPPAPSTTSSPGP